jgi:hypothetical protein
VVLAGQCDEYDGPCVVGAVEVSGPEQAQAVKDKLLPGEVAHYIAVTPADDWLGGVDG